MSSLCPQAADHYAIAAGPYQPSRGAEPYVTRYLAWHRRHTRQRWSVGLLLGIGLHLLLALLMFSWINKASPLGALPPAVIIELALYQQSRPAPADIPPGPQQNMAAPDHQPPIEQEQLDLPKLAAAPNGSFAAPPEKVVRKKKPRPTPRLPEPEMPVIAETPAPTTSAPLPGSAPKDSAAFASASPMAISGKASWQSDVLAHLARHKRYPREALRYRLQGISQVRFTVDHLGRILQAELIASSGAKILDRETLALIARAQPLPKPPAELLFNGTLELVAPIAYNLKH